MSRNIIFVLLYHLHKLLDLIYVSRMDLVYKYIPSLENFNGLRICSLVISASAVTA
jgi:hypothetical protein